MKTTALANWFGSNRMLAENVGRLLKGCEWVGVPFAGGMCELAHIDARTINAADLHAHVVNLAAVVAHEQLGGMLVMQLDSLPFHQKILEQAQARLSSMERGFAMPCMPDLDWAVRYFVCSWMARAGAAGTEGEFKAGMSVRWNASGGDSAVRFRSATEALTHWQKIMRRCTFVCLDAFEFLAKCKDVKGHGVYCDPPFPGPGDKYKHRFDEAAHRRLAETLRAYQHARVVCRFYDHPLIVELYRELDGWTWHRLAGRTQTNAEAPEVLLTRN